MQTKKEYLKPCEEEKKNTGHKKKTRSSKRSWVTTQTTVPNKIINPSRRKNTP